MGLFSEDESRFEEILEGDFPMTRLRLNEHHAEAVVLGGAVLGGGGGGSIRDGMERANLAVRLGSPVLVSLDELKDKDLVLTASVVGAPAAAEKFLRPVDHIRAATLLLEKRPLKLAGLIANENGASSGVNGWLQAAMMNVPVVDAPANGRAHPTGLMGAMGLQRIQGYTSIQAAAGGNPETGRYVEIVAEGAIQSMAHLIRFASVQAGGTVAVARDPVTAKYLKGHAAPGGTTQAIKVGFRKNLIYVRGSDIPRRFLCVRLVVFLRFHSDFTLRETPCRPTAIQLCGS